MTNRQLIGMALLPLTVFAQEDSGRITVPEASTNVTITMPAPSAPAAELLPEGETRKVETGVIVAAGGTVFEAVDAVVGQLERVLALELLGEAERAELTKTLNRFGTAGKRIPWDKALEEVLRPTHFAYYEDGVIVKIGTREQVDALYAIQQTEKLAANHTRIDPDFSGGMDIYMALCAIRIQAGISMNFDYMRPEHRGIVQPLAAVDQAQTGKVTVPTQQQPGVKTTYAVPPGQKIEWRIVLKEVLDPIGYTFIEDNGTVKPMPTEQLVKFNQDKINAKPLVTKFVRVHHAKADTILEKIRKMNLIRHAQGFIDASQGKDDKAKIFQGQSAGIATGNSGQQLGAQIQSSGSSFSTLVRQSTPPGLIIADIAENIPVIEEHIRMLDVREKQVLIEALILDLSETTATELGVKWGDLGISYNSQMAMNRPNTFVDVGDNGEVTMQTLTTSDGNTITLNKPVTVTRIPQSSDLTSPVNLEDWAGKLAKDRFSAVPISFDAVLKMVQGDAYSKLLSNPTLTVGDHCDSAIQVGMVTPVEQVSVNYVGSGSQTPISAQSVEWLSLQTGIMLWVSPEISEDGKFVRLSVHPQITDIAGEVTAATGEKNYKVTTQELDTRVTVPSGQTIMLGGLIRPATEKSVSKVPWLGDIPYLGRLFRYTSTSTTSRHLVLLIRPTILDDNAPKTGYEESTLNVADPMLKNLGKNLDPDYGAYRPEEVEKRKLKALTKGKEAGAADGQETAEQRANVSSNAVPQVSSSVDKPGAIAHPASILPAAVQQQPEMPTVESVRQKEPVAAPATPDTSEQHQASIPPTESVRPEAAKPAPDAPLVVPSDK